MNWGHTVLALGLLLLVRSAQCGKLQQSQLAVCPGAENGQCGPLCRIAVCQASVGYWAACRHTLDGASRQQQLQQQQQRKKCTVMIY
jgi:hypothetical protein